MAKGKLFFWSCLSFICGVFINSFFNIPQQVLLGFLFILAISLFVFRFDKRLLIAGILLLAFSLGGFRYQSEAGKIFESELREFNGASQTLNLVGVIYDEPDSRDSSQQLKTRIENLSGSRIQENLLVIASKYPSYHYGDRIKIQGKLKTPENFEKFNYQGYLQKERIYSTMIFPKVELLESSQGSSIRKVLFEFKDRFRETWQKLLSPPHLGIFEALTFGEEGNIPSSWKEKLNLSGTRHLTAVSGMNITIISFLLAGTLLSLGFWRQQASLISLIFIWLYVLMIGAPASALRAGLMVSLFLAAQFSGRLAAGSRSLVFSAAVILAENPLLLRFDVGFQLSFLAMAGLIYWQPFFKQKVFRRLPDFFRTNLSATFAAQVFTLPLLIYNFGYVSLISPLTNILLVPLIPYLTIIGFVFGILGMISLFFGQILSWILWLGLSYILLVIDLSLKIPFAHLVFGNLSAILVLAAYLFLILATWKIQSARKQEFFY
ncbi:MAG: ComEC/Rec2 family competence protein [bacterium]|nr:ComEC/Rec2 family competence protein [bacterium]